MGEEDRPSRREDTPASDDSDAEDPVRDTQPDGSVTTTTETVVTQVSPPTRRREEVREACLVVMYGEDLGRRVPLGTDPVVLGRSTQADVQIDQESVSRSHCRIWLDGSRYRLEDLGSTNGTYVNDEQATGRMELRDGDQVKVGRTILKFIVGGNIEAQYHEEIYRLMTVDGLTQVHNKRYFDEMLEREVSRATRYAKTFSLVLFDIDHFKEINDTHGHLAGDAILRQLGNVVRRRTRRDDVIARIGGEEFALLLPELDVEAAAGVADMLRQLIEQTRFEFEGTVIPVTCSLGVAQWQPSHGEGADILKAADDKLYEAKRTGRNRVCR
ncbi:MAG: GGDEF domain-containing protein [Myxococcota bacterium]